jgi:hypothetical protein
MKEHFFLKKSLFFLCLTSESTDNINEAIKKIKNDFNKLNNLFTFTK